MEKRLIVALLILGFVALTSTVPSQRSVTPSVQASGERTMVLDVACDARTCRINQVDPTVPQPGLNFARGDTFIVDGTIYPGSTIPPGGTFDTPSPFGPDEPGRIGTWVCRGTFNLSAAEAEAGAAPHISTTQLFLLDDGNGLVTEGSEGGLPMVLRAVTGGLGDFNGVRGQVTEEELGVNSTGLFNFRMVFEIENQTESRRQP
ncbi:MAG: hypothetical protein D6723_05850 [Acidobacteria bacterium]|nr:MAG: hypothetical protein D6723_05850 [Acidobacteriota bacterium]